MTDKFTPGPWVVQAKCNAAINRHPAIISDTGEVAKASWQGGEMMTQANATLLASAPDLLAALQELLEDADSYAADGIYPSPLTRSKARAAIAKARGL